MKDIALSLTGGGARGAYQAGVLLGIATILNEKNSSKNFDFYSGVSAGAVNSAFLASSKESFLASTQALCKLWSELSAGDIYKTDFMAMSKIGWGWIRDTSFGGIIRGRNANFLLNSDPLKDLIKAHIDFEQIHKNISEKKVKALALTAFNYSENRSICFYNSNPKVSPWERSRRSSQYCKITSTHVAASAAIPVVFKPVSLEGHYYGDGALRNTAPLSPIIHFGAKKVLHIGVKHDLMLKKPLTINQPPSVAEIFGSLLNGLFFDATEMDVERFKMANKIIDSNPNDQSGFRNIPLLCFKPSESLSYIAEQLSSESLPTIVSYLLRGLGNDQEYAELSSYLLFDKTYTSQLIQLGEKDAHNKKNEILEFFFGF